MQGRTADEWQRWVEEFSGGKSPEAWRGIMCFLRWIQIRAENGHPVPTGLLALEGDLYHSALLRRLIAGKEPLDHAPPESFGYPWYELVESGRGHAVEVRPWEWAPGHKIVINQGIWTILEKRSEEEYRVAYRPDGEAYRLTKVAEDDWLLEVERA